VYTHKVHACIFVACAVSKKMWYPIPKTSDVKKDEVAEWLKGVKSLWGQEEKMYQQDCVELQHTKQLLLATFLNEVEKKATNQQIMMHQLY